MILTAPSRHEDPGSENALEFAARLWLRTALLAWLLWLGPLAAVVLAGLWRQS